MDKIFILPNFQSPFKDTSIFSVEERVTMIDLVISSCNDKKISFLDTELKSSKMAYTIDTISSLKMIMPDSLLYFVLGSDSFFELHRWKSYEKLVEMVHFIIFKRDAVSPLDYDSYLERELPFVSSERFVFLDNDAFNVSSTMVRQKLFQLETISHLVPKSVNSYIESLPRFQEIRK